MLTCIPLQTFYSVPSDRIHELKSEMSMMEVFVLMSIKAKTEGQELESKPEEKMERGKKNEKIL